MKTFFISSTFKDMQAERDILHERVFPRLRTLIKSFGEDVQEVDLRWGVDTVNMSEEESGHEVLRICIDAIDRCKPYLIVLLGERYGWIPGKAIVDSARDQRISDRYEQEMSITELEIQYGALLNNDAFDKCIFCFRDPRVMDKIDSDQLCHYRSESPRHAQRLTALKHQIYARDDAIILEYSADWDSTHATLCGLEDFEEQVYQQLAVMIRKDLEGQQVKSLQARQVSEVELIRDGYLSSYVRRYPEEFWITKYLADFQQEISMYDGARKTDCVLVSGRAGTGKSALMAYMASSIPKIRDNTILCFAAASGCKDVPSLKRYIAHRLETILSEPHNEESASIDKLLRTLDKKAEKKGIICFVDALDQIYQDVQDPYLDLPALCPNLFWVFSALPDFPFAQAAADYTYHIVQVDDLFPAQRAELIHSTASKRGKKLDNALVQMISERPGAGNPLFLSLVLQRLFMMNKAEFEAAEAIAPGMEGLHRYMQNLLVEMPDMPDRMATYILNVTANLFDQEQFADVLMLIANSHDGLTEQDLEYLLALEGLRFSPVKFQQTVSYLYDAFHQRSNGKWDFHHRLFQEAVLELMTQEELVRINNLLTDYTLGNEEFLRQEGFRYLLAQRHPAFYKVLETAVSWENSAQVFDLIGTYARDDATAREFLETVSKAHLSDAMAGFWLTFEEYLYGDDVDAMSGRIVGALLKAPVSDDKKWQLALRHTYDAQKDQLLSFIALAQTCADHLPDPDQTIAVASIQAEHARALTILHRPYSQVRDAMHLSMAAIDRAMVLLNPQSPWKSFVQLLDAGRTTARLATSWAEPDADKMWLKLLEHVNSLADFSATQEDDYTYYKVLFLVELCDIYCGKPWKDYDKSRHYGNQALELSEIAASQRPTIRNFKNKYNANAAYSRRLKDSYAYPYRQQNVDCARRLYALQKTDANKWQLAAAEAECGIAYLRALQDKVEKYQFHAREEAKRCLDHSAELFEELIASGYSVSQTVSHATFLADRVILLSDSYDKLIVYGKRSLELLQQRQQDIQKQYDEEPVPENKAYYLRQIDWFVGWTGRVKAAMATVFMELLDHENALCYAREGMELNRLNAKRAPAYLTELLGCALIVAQSSYCLRKDSDALAACQEATNLLDQCGSQGESREPFDAELYYIRSRIALAHGEIESAWSYCQECLSRKKSRLLSNKVLILKADCLQALGDAESDNAWWDALEVWRKELAALARAFQTEAMNIQSLNDGPVTVKVKWPSYKNFTLPAYYMAYCYHHYVTDEKRYRKVYDIFEQKVLFALYYQGKGYLKDRMPYGLKTRQLPVCSDTPVPDCPDFKSFIAAMESMTGYQDNQLDPAICKLILKNTEKFLDASPTGKQVGVLQNIAATLCEQLLEERGDLYHEKQECDLLRELFHLDDHFPDFKITLDWHGAICAIWPQEYVENTSRSWHALLKLLLLMVRKAPGLIRQNSSRLNSAYRVVSEQMGGSQEIEKADLRFLSPWELDALLRSYDLESELRISFFNIYWYALKNVWTAELYRRNNDPAHITRRLQELEEFLTEPYIQLYQQLDTRGKTDMPTEIVQAVKHLVRALNERCQGAMALEVIRWSESIPALSGRLDSKTLYGVTPVTDTDRRWLEEVKLLHSRKWLEADDGKLSSIRRA